MKIGIIGLGKMGQGIVERLLKAQHSVVGFDLDQNHMIEAQQLGAVVVDTISDLAKECRVVWLMVPPGKPVDAVLEQIIPHAQKGDIIVDGGNSNFNDSIARAKKLKEMGLFYLDCGTSGGLHGRVNGYCLMVGGDKNAYTTIEPILHAIAIKNGVGYMGKSGAGHYVKMIHNGIEYGLMEAYAEGFHVIKEGSFKDQLDLAEITRVWNHGSIVRSYLLELAHDIFKEDQQLNSISGEVAEGGTGAWTAQEAEKNEIPVPIIEKSVGIRAWSRTLGGNYATKIVAMLRNKFGGHAVKKL
jgi:6-phosphogluconate dehydrogenase